MPDRAEPRVPSLTSIYHSANFQEREVWDLFGIHFEGHPDLRRILLWEGFEGHPLRKDYREPYYEEDQKPFRSRWPRLNAGPGGPRSESAGAEMSNIRKLYPEHWQPLPEFEVLPGSRIG